MAEGGSATLEVPPLVVLDTDRLRLRTLQVSDTQRLLPLLARKEVMQWTTQGPQSTLEQAERWVSTRALGADVFNFAVTLRSDPDGEQTGIIGIAGSFHPPKIGYLFHPGTATNACLSMRHVGRRWVTGKLSHRSLRQRLRHRSHAGYHLCSL